MVSLQIYQSLFTHYFPAFKALVKQEMLPTHIHSPPFLLRNIHNRLPLTCCSITTVFWRPHAHTSSIEERVFRSILGRIPLFSFLTRHIACMRFMSLLCNLLAFCLVIRSGCCSHTYLTPLILPFMFQSKRVSNQPFDEAVEVSGDDSTTLGSPSPDQPSSPAAVDKKQSTDQKQKAMSQSEKQKQGGYLLF